MSIVGALTFRDGDVKAADGSTRKQAAQDATHAVAGRTVSAAAPKHAGGESPLVKPPAFQRYSSSRITACSHSSSRSVLSSNEGAAAGFRVEPSRCVVFGSINKDVAIQTSGRRPAHTHTHTRTHARTHAHTHMHARALSLTQVSLHATFTSTPVEAAVWKRWKLP